MTVYCSLLHRQIISMKRKGIGRDSLPHAESISGFHESSNPLDAKNRHPLFSECRFCYPIIALIFGAGLA